MVIVALIQARMGSSRLPGKVLAEIEGRPMLLHIVDRLLAANGPDLVGVATSDQESDSPIRALAEEHDIPVFAGSEDDVVDRFLRAARHFDAEAVVRVTGDSPFVDPEVVDRLVSAYRTRGEMVACVSNHDPPSYPLGLDAEIYPTATFDRLWNDITDPFWRDWFAIYMRKRPAKFPILNVGYREDLSHIRLTVDYPADLRLARELYRRLFRPGRVFHLQEILDTLRREPALVEINAGYRAAAGFEAALARRDGEANSGT
jgi:spore coat polysaccharide biosynthesis protein SpsF (cytidylyltransferase family)